MKLRIEVDEDMEEEEILIKCCKLTPEIVKLQNVINESISSSNQFVFYKENTEYYLSIEDILFFETASNTVNAHTRDEVYQTRYKLYELEEKLPNYFLRISKSTIVNLNKVYAISRNITASSKIQFQNSHKEIYVSRIYYKVLKEKLEEKRLRL